jgi:hypothetical protein
VLSVCVALESVGLKNVEKKYLFLGLKSACYDVLCATSYWDSVGGILGEGPLRATHDLDCFY